MYVLMASDKKYFGLTFAPKRFMSWNTVLTEFWMDYIEMGHLSFLTLESSMAAVNTRNGKQREIFGEISSQFFGQFMTCESILRRHQ